jgi:hypothetical protein
MQYRLLKTLVSYLGIWFLGWGVPMSIAYADNQEKHIIGWIETVQILPENFQLSAKIDTGADNSSLNILNPLEFNKEEEQWIRFTIPLEENEALTLERPIERYAYIKRKGAPKQKRPVVLFDLCVGTLYKKNVPINLADRTGFKYPMLIGRSFLKDSAIVDSALTFTQSPSCSAPLDE